MFVSYNRFCSEIKEDPMSHFPGYLSGICYKILQIQHSLFVINIVCNTKFVMLGTQRVYRENDSTTQDMGLAFQKVHSHLYLYLDASLLEFPSASHVYGKVVAVALCLTKLYHTTVNN